GEANMIEPSSEAQDQSHMAKDPTTVGIAAETVEKGATAVDVSGDIMEEVVKIAQEATAAADVVAEEVVLTNEAANDVVVDEASKVAEEEDVE
ncbi:hypothetical protein Dimus_017949, partial [Dionaea muscipula]